MRRLVERWVNNPVFILEGLRFDLSEQIYELMQRKGLTEKDLAEKMGVKVSHVKRILGAERMSLYTIAKVLAALDAGDMTLKIVKVSELWENSEK